MQDKTYQIMSIVNCFMNKMQDLQESDQLSCKVKEDTENLYSQAIQLQCKISYGHVFTVDDFISKVKEGEFTDYDGSGEFVSADGIPVPQDIRCNVEWLENNRRKSCPFIIWYNK